MKIRFVTRREAALRQIAGIGPFVEGTLVKVPHKTCSHVAHRLTFKVAGKTRAQVEAERLEAVRTGDIVSTLEGYGGQKLNEIFPGQYPSSH